MHWVSTTQEMPEFKSQTICLNILMMFVSLVCQTNVQHCALGFYTNLCSDLFQVAVSQTKPTHALIYRMLQIPHVCSIFLLVGFFRSSSSSHQRFHNSNPTASSNPPPKVQGILCLPCSWHSNHRRQDSSMGPTWIQVGAQSKATAWGNTRRHPQGHKIRFTPGYANLFEPAVQHEAVPINWLKWNA